jgi:hypothetical protein
VARGNETLQKFNPARQAISLAARWKGTIANQYETVWVTQRIVLESIENETISFFKVNVEQIKQRGTSVALQREGSASEEQHIV